MECCALAVRFCLHRIHASSLLALALMAALQLWSHWSTFCLWLVPCGGWQSGRSWSATVPCIRRCDIAALFLCDRYMMCSMMLMSGAAARGIITQLAQKVCATSGVCVTAASVRVRQERCKNTELNGNTR